MVHTLLHRSAWSRLLTPSLHQNPAWIENQQIRSSVLLYRIINHFPAFLFKSLSFNMNITSSLTSKVGGCAFLALIVFQTEAIFRSLNPTASVSIDHCLLMVGCRINAPPPLNSLPVGALTPALVSRRVWNATCGPHLLMWVMETDTDFCWRMASLSFSTCEDNCSTVALKP